MTLVLAILAFLSDEKKAVEVVCPVDGHRFTAYEVVVTNHWGGVDTDFCRHAFKTTPLEYFVWVCPSCAFAGRKKDFSEKLPDEQKRALRAGLRPQAAVKPGVKQPEIPGFVKYDLLAQVARLRGLPPEEAGKAYLNASWSCRQQGAVYLDGFDEWESLRTSYGLNRTPLELGVEKDKRPKNRTAYELEIARKIEKDIDGKKHEKGVNRTLSRYLAAYLFRKHGENADAERWLAELAKLKGENSVTEEAAAKMEASIAREREFQKKAIECFTASLDSGKLPKPAAAETAYLLGELHRRTGDLKGAAQFYQRALATSESEALSDQARQQKALVERP